MVVEFKINLKSYWCFKDNKKNRKKIKMKFFIRILQKADDGYFFLDNNVLYFMDRNVIASFCLHELDV